MTGRQAMLRLLIGEPTHQLGSVPSQPVDALPKVLHTATLELLQGESIDELLEALFACLPARVDFHCAKIAGDELLFQLPFLPPRGLSYATEQDVQHAAPGDLVYWPERQMLALFFGRKQKETASVVALGRVVDGLQRLRQVGERVQREQGAAIVWGILDVEGAAPRRLPAGRVQHHDDPLDWIREARLRMWRHPPPEVAALLRQQGVMRPVGPLLYAESETRKLHEWLWVFRETLPSAPVHVLVALLRHSSQRLGGFSQLEEAASFLAYTANWLEQRPELLSSVLDELLLYVGRLNGWLDLCIPWYRFNMAINEVAASMAQSLRPFLETRSSVDPFSSP